MSIRQVILQQIEINCQPRAAPNCGPSILISFQHIHRALHIVPLSMLKKI